MVEQDLRPMTGRKRKFSYPRLDPSALPTKQPTNRAQSTMRVENINRRRSDEHPSRPLWVQHQPMYWLLLAAPYSARDLRIDDKWHKVHPVQSVRCSEQQWCDAHTIWGRDKMAPQQQSVVTSRIFGRRKDNDVELFDDRVSRSLRYCRDER